MPPGLHFTNRTFVDNRHADTAAFGYDANGNLTIVGPGEATPGETAWRVSSERKAVWG